MLLTQYHATVSKIAFPEGAKLHDTGSFSEHRSTDDVKKKAENKKIQTRPNHKRSETLQIQCSPVLAEGPMIYLCSNSEDDVGNPSLLHKVYMQEQFRCQEIEICPEMHVNEMHELIDMMIDITRCPLH